LPQGGSVLGAYFQTTDHELPGRVIRWYKAKGSLYRLEKELKSGRRQAVPKADSITLAMDLSDGQVPKDLDWSWYIGEARKIIQSTPGYHHRAVEFLQDHTGATRLHEMGLTLFPSGGRCSPRACRRATPFRLISGTGIATIL
jgi:hypothetical protein